VFGDAAKVQRCVLHKRRNVEGHLGKELAGVVDKRLALIFAQPDAVKGLAAARSLAKELEANHPDAAASLREGHDMFTVRRLGVGGTLAGTLTTTNCIESMISIAKRTIPTSHEMEGRFHEEALDRRRHARSRAFVPTRPRSQGHGQAGRCPSPRGHTGRCYTRRVRSGSSLNMLWPPLNFNKKRDIVSRKYVVRTAARRN
jgi:electron transfer flavoprotein alpha subunit